MRRVFILTGLFALVLNCGVLPAQSVGVVPVAGDSGTDARPFMIGYEFSVSTATTISGLGYLDGTGAGLNEAHLVGIFDGVSGALLTSTTIPAGAIAPLVNGFRILPVTYTLGPGVYVIAGQKPTNADFAVVRATSTISGAGIRYVQERELQTSSFTMPTTNFQMNEVGSFGPGFTVATPPSTPVISGLVNGASFRAAFSPNTYVSIFGSNLSATSRVWGPSDFKNGNQLPTSLDGVTVTVGGSPAYVEFISPTQINIITPNIATSGSGVPVTVNVPGQSPITAWFGLQLESPAFFTWQTGTADSGKYVVAQHSDYTRVGKTGLFPNQAAGYTTPAKAGETVILYGTGFGSTSPSIAPGIITDKIYPVSPLPTATIGGKTATVQFAGLIPLLSQVFQVNITIPAGLNDGDQTLVLNVNGTLSAASTITVSH
jgi:uncharacterized protein (TIGR03437 family)